MSIHEINQTNASDWTDVNMSCCYCKAVQKHTFILLNVPLAGMIGFIC